MAEIQFLLRTVAYNVGSYLNMNTQSPSVRRSTVSSGIQCYWSLTIYTNQNKYLL